MAFTSFYRLCFQNCLLEYDLNSELLRTAFNFNQLWVEGFCLLKSCTFYLFFLLSNKLFYPLGSNSYSKTSSGRYCQCCNSYHSIDLNYNLWFLLLGKHFNREQDKIPISHKWGKMRNEQITRRNFGGKSSCMFYSKGPRTRDSVQVPISCFFSLTKKLINYLKLQMQAGRGFMQYCLIYKI